MEVNDKKIKENLTLTENRTEVDKKEEIDTENQKGGKADTQKTDVDDLQEVERENSKYIKEIKVETNQKDNKTENVKRILKMNEDDVGEDEKVEQISEKEAESRFLLWYNDICEREEWYKRRIKELETFEERSKQTIASLKDNDRKLQQRYAQALIEIKVLRKKNLSINDDQEFLESYKSLSTERDKLTNAVREQNHIIKSLKRDMHFLRARRSLEYAQRHKMRKMEFRTTTERLMKQTRITELAEIRNGPPREVLKTRKFENHSVLSKTNVIKTDCVSNKSSPNRKVQREEDKRWEEVDGSAKNERNKNKNTPLVSLPDIREKPGHVSWRW